MTATTSPSSIREHTLARGGSISVVTVDTEIRLRGVDGDTTRIRLTGGDLDSEFRIAAAPDRIEIRPIRRWTLGWRRLLGPLEIDVPRDAHVDLRSASGSIRALDLVLDTRVRTTSGDVELAGVGGHVRVDVVSGGIRVHSPSAVRLALASVSGRIEVVATTLASIEARSMSAGIRVMGRLRGKGPFSLESVSGDVTLGTDEHVRLVASTLSGEVRSEIGGRSDASSGGSRTIALGDDGPVMGVRTVSGRICLVPWAGSPADGTASRDAGGDPAAAGGLAVPGPRAPAAGPLGPELIGASETTVNEPNGGSERVEQALPLDDDPRLPILRALQRGDISVEEAGRRIEAVDAAAVAVDLAEPAEAASDE